jgi:hypothetical protein
VGDEPHPESREGERRPAPPPSAHPWAAAVRLRGVWGERLARQVRREFRERAVEAQGIGSQLAGDGGVPADLRAIERKLRQLQRRETWGDPLGVEALVAETLEDLKMFEYALRRELEGTDVEKLRPSGSAEVPEGWRRLVEEYYRSLSRDGS